MYVSVRDSHLGVFGTINMGLRAMGIDAVELRYDKDRSVPSLDISHPGAKESLANENMIDRFAYKCDGLRIRPSAFILGNNFGATDIEAELEWVISAGKAAGQIGMKAVRIDAAMSTQNEWTLEKRTSHFADCMKRVLDATHDLDVSFGIENHGHKGNEQEFLDSVIDSVGSPRLGITLDTGNFYWFGLPLSKVYETIRHFAPKTKHTHIKSINYPADQREIQRPTGWEYGKYCSPLREGDIDVGKVVRMLKDANYTGDLCIENESLGRFEKYKQKAVLIDDAAYIKEKLNAL